MGLGFGSVEDLPVEEGGGVARHHELVRVRVRVRVRVGVRVRVRVLHIILLLQCAGCP